MVSEQLTEMDRLEVTLWRIVGRYDEALSAGAHDVASKLLDGFKRRLTAYQHAADQEHGS